MAKSFNLTVDTMSLLGIPWVKTSQYTTATDLRSFARSAGIRKEAAMQRQLSESINEAIMNNEKGAHDRVVYETKSVIVLSPYAASVAYEMWVIPKRHFACLFVGFPS